MKKVKYFALALVLVLGLMGGAYAAWTDSVVFSGTVNTGEMEVKFDSLVHTDGEYDRITAWTTDGRNTLNVTLNDLYPRKQYGAEGDAYAYLQFQFSNEGTVPVRLTSVNASGNHIAREYLAVDDGNDNLAIGYSALAAFIADDWATAYGVIEPGETRELEVYFRLAEDTPNYAQKSSANVTLTANWEQANLSE